MNKIINDNIDFEEIFPFKIIIFFLVLIILYLCFQCFFSKEEILIEIEKMKNQSLSFSEKISCFTKINTKINRDYLEDSKFYNEKGFKEIFGKQYNKNNSNINKGKIENNKINKKVKFSNIIVFDYDN
jgi:hypothetical protein